MSLIHPFRALRPAHGHAGEVMAPPYDVLSSEEARERARHRPWSFLHVSKAEIDLPAEADPYSQEVYLRAAANLAGMIHAGVLLREEQSCYYAYRLTMGEHVQTGLAALAKVEAYEQGRIRRHELTRPEKEDDRVHHMEALNAQTGPVLLAYPEAADADREIEAIAEGEPDLEVTSREGVRHQVWTLRDPERIAHITRTFESMAALYIADGHHRSAAAARVAARRHEPGARLSSDYFLVVMFPHHELKILPYYRVVRSLPPAVADAAALVEALRESFSIEPSDGPVDPRQQGEFGMYVARKWFRLRIRPERIPDDVVASLDVSLLTDSLLAPVLGIGDLRKDPRIDFVGGARGLEELERLVDSGEMALAFSTFATSMEQLMTVADEERMMPPKSTWFEPKLADGLLSHVLDGAL